MLSFKRDFNAKRLNAVVNDPAVFSEVAMPGQEIGKLDFTPLAQDLNNYILMTDKGGIVAHRQELGIFEIHTQFLEDYRGHAAIRTVRDMVSWLFINSDAVELLTKIPERNPAALGLVRAIQGKFEFNRAGAYTAHDGNICGVDYYSLAFRDWASSIYAVDRLAKSGREFHAKLEELQQGSAKRHPEDAIHDIMVGATVEQIFAGQVDKALILYNRWARFAGYAEVRLLSRLPLILDIQDSVLLIHPHERGFEVLEVRQCQSG